MKYYHYISETKVNMLYPQIPTQLMERLEGKLSFSKGGMYAEAGIKPKEPNLIQKTQLIEKFILSNGSLYDVGTPDLNHKYFYGKDKFLVGVKNNILYLKSPKIFLMGSANHIVNANYSPPTISGSVVHALDELMRTKIEQEDEITNLDYHWLLDEESLLITLREWETYVLLDDGTPLSFMEMEFEYLAKRLYYFPSNKPFALATPIYIAEY